MKAYRIKSNENEYVIVGKTVDSVIEFLEETLNKKLITIEVEEIKNVSIIYTTDKNLKI